MDLKICPKGHNYNGDINATCPVCEAEKRGGGMTEDYGATEPVGGGFGGGMAGATEPVSGGFGGMAGATEPVSRGFGGMAGATEPVTGGFGRGSGGSDTLPPKPSAFFKGNGRSMGDETMRFCDNGVPGVDNYNDQTMPHNPGMTAGFTPVAGWLVCIDGPDKGNDYRVRSGYNYIGRAEHMDICIRGDKQISREKHAIIAYDDTENVFFFGPSDGRNIVRVNGKMVMVPTQLNAYDIVTVGSSKLVFVPLCTDKFNWEN